MTFDWLSDVNYLAVLVAAIAYFALGALWYSPVLFSRIWIRATGLDMSEAGPPLPALMVVNLIAYFVAGVATAILALASGTDTAMEGLVLGLVLGIGFALPAAGVVALYEKKPEPLTYFLINGVYNTLGVIILALIISLMQ